MPMIGNYKVGMHTGKGYTFFVIYPAVDFCDVCNRPHDAQAKGCPYIQSYETWAASQGLHPWSVVGKQPPGATLTFTLQGLPKASPADDEMSPFLRRQLGLDRTKPKRVCIGLGGKSRTCGCEACEAP